jgi:hypothetical protein
MISFLPALAASCGSRALSGGDGAAPEAGLPDAVDVGVGVAEAAPEAAPDVGQQVPTVVEPSHLDCKSLYLAAADGVLYWTDEAMGAVLRAPESGGAPQVLTDGENGPVRIAVRSGRVFWMAGRAPASQGSRLIATAVRTLSIAGGDATTVVAPAEGVAGFAASPDAATVYFSSGQAVQKVSTTGTAAPVDLLVPTGDVTPMGVALEGARLAVSDGIIGAVYALDLVDGQMSTCNFTDTHGGPPGTRCRRSVFDNGGLLLDPILLDQGRVYWADNATIKSWDTNTLQSAYLADVTNLSVAVSSLALAGDTIYYAAADPMNAAAVGEIGSLPAQWPPTGSQATPTTVVLASAQNNPRSIAYDAGRLFWSTAGCQILSIAAGP